MSKPNRRSEINPKQKQFADNYILTGNAYQSAIDAGYKESTANSRTKDMLEHPTIKEYIKNRLKEIDNAKIADQKEVLEYLTQVLRGEIKEEVLIGTGMGEQKTIEVDVPTRERTKAAELLGKRYSIWTDKVEVDTNMVVIKDDIE